LTAPEIPDLPRIADTLARHHVEYLFVGGIAWRTDAGDLDILADIPDRDGRHLTYSRLAARDAELNLDGIAVRVAALDDVIASKEWADRPKDRDALDELLALRQRDQHD
jgi:hypothetical protein